MFDTYKDIFERRGLLYHQAMVKYPLARAAEFNNILQLAKIEDGNTICDIPSGGGYISNFIDRQVNIISVETSIEFAKNIQTKTSRSIITCDDVANIDLPSDTADRIISLAGTHHIENKINFYRESYRLLKKGGLFCIADAKEDSKVARFLNIFVDRYNSMGHRGIFLDDNTKKELESIDFKVIYNSSIEYHWCFDSCQATIEYCQLLFGLDLASPEQILAGIEEYLGYDIRDDRYYLNWELYFILSLK
jgi:cyclopropane fatty-acyl-phospholipid synthase-like methyltransferase